MFKRILLTSILILPYLTPSASAAENTTLVDGVTYVKVSEIATKYGITINQQGKEEKLVKDGKEVIVPAVGSAAYYVNGEAYAGIRPTLAIKEEKYMATRDFADLFNMALTYINGVSNLTPTDKEPNTLDDSIENGIYTIGNSWGNINPMTVIRNSSTDSITNVTINKKPYTTDNHNELEDVIQR